MHFETELFSHPACKQAPYRELAATVVERPSPWQGMPALAVEVSGPEFDGLTTHLSAARKVNAQVGDSATVIVPVCGECPFADECSSEGMCGRLDHAGPDPLYLVVVRGRPDWWGYHA